MIKLLFLVVFAAVIYADSTDMQSKIKDISIDSLPGVSEQSIAKLREMLTPPPSTIEEVKNKVEQWIAGLPVNEKLAIQQHIDEMRQKLKLENTDIKIH